MLLNVAGQSGVQEHGNEPPLPLRKIYSEFKFAIANVALEALKQGSHFLNTRLNHARRYVLSKMSRIILRHAFDKTLAKSVRSNYSARYNATSIKFTIDFILNITTDVIY
ncbi:hypothetical protein QA634_20235 [Methylobacterium sp. CB376]|uniref:hypothetical protein n=1 Tax=unclassified Methylobacterium TaxID=2615210 RepID=UPI0012376DEF|nr:MULTISPECIES: hypothetical protein [Methylobacterium]WFT77644.1 hypothetical protein QA634_20235 [Methylobacterium nodulans]